MAFEFRLGRRSWLLWSFEGSAEGRAVMAVVVLSSLVFFLFLYLFVCLFLHYLLSPRQRRRTAPVWSVGIFSEHHPVSSAMQLRHLLLLVTALLAAVILSTPVVQAEEAVESLTADTFDDYITKHKHAVVQFYAPWCGHCKNLAPHYEAAAKILEEEDDIHLAKVDATVETDLASKFNVRGYPTIKIFIEGKPMEYKGGRTEGEIITYLRKKFGPPASEIADAAALEKAKENNKVIVVAFLEAASGDVYEDFVAHAQTDDKISYFYTTNADLASAEEVTAPAVVLFKQFDEGKNTLTESINRASIKNFVNNNSNPLVIPFDMSVVQTVFSSPKGKVAFLFRKPEQAEELDEAFHKLAKEFRDIAVFATSDWSESRLNGYVGVTPGAEPQLTLLKTPRSGQMQKFPLGEKPTEESMRAHLQAFKDGTLKPHFKSAEIPESNDGPVTVVVGKNFDEIVLDEEKDVLFEVYAPWCGHCKKLAPTYEKLGEHFAKDPNVVIAKMDGTENEVEGLVASGYPTIKFYPAGAKTASKGLSYSGGRDLDSLIKYIEDNRKSSPPAEEHEHTHDDL